MQGMQSVQSILRFKPNGGGIASGTVAAVAADSSQSPGSNGSCRADHYEPLAQADIHHIPLNLTQAVCHVVHAKRQESHDVQATWQCQR